MTDWKNWMNLIILISFCLLSSFAITIGCFQENTISGDYLNEANNTEYIAFGDGTFIHAYYNLTPITKTGSFRVNKNVLILNYSDGENVSYTISENELVPTGENVSVPENMSLWNGRYAKRLRQ